MHILAAGCHMSDWGEGVLVRWIRLQYKAGCAHISTEMWERGTKRRRERALQSPQSYYAPDALLLAPQVSSLSHLSSFTCCQLAATDISGAAASPGTACQSAPVRPHTAAGVHGRAPSLYVRPNRDLSPPSRPTTCCLHCCHRCQRSCYGT